MFVCIYLPTCYSLLVVVVHMAGRAKAAGKSEEVIYPIRQDWEGRPSAAFAADQFAHLLTPCSPELLHHLLSIYMSCSDDNVLLGDRTTNVNCESHLGA